MFRITARRKMPNPFAQLMFSDSVKQTQIENGTRRANETERGEKPEPGREEERVERQQAEVRARHGTFASVTRRPRSLVSRG